MKCQNYARKQSGAFLWPTMYHVTTADIVETCHELKMSNDRSLSYVPDSAASTVCLKHRRRRNETDKK